MKNAITIIPIALIVLCIGVFIGITKSNDSPLGSVITGQEYYATSTIHNAVVSTRLIRGGWGSLGSVVVTGAGTSAFSLIDATSTDSISGDTRISTSSQLLATIPASLAAGTYTFDVTYNRGLLVYFDTVGTAPTSTITFR
jgi:hypothetical protein